VLHLYGSPYHEREILLVRSQSCKSTGFLPYVPLLLLSRVGNGVLDYLLLLMDLHETPQDVAIKRTLSLCRTEPPPRAFTGTTVTK
jgi:hypothetical protein